MDIASIKGCIGNRKAGILGQEESFQSAVILPLVHHKGELCVMFEVRNRNLTIQPGEICFPGGRVEPDDGGAKAAAVREFCEEMRTDPDNLQVIAQLDSLVTPFNVIVHSFVGYVKDGSLLDPNPDEVEKVFCVPLDYLLKTEPRREGVIVRMIPPEDYPYHLIPQGRNYPWREGYYPQVFYIYDDQVIWGLTARILLHFLNLIRPCSGNK